MTEPAREVREIAWDKFMQVLLNAIQEDEVIKEAAHVWWQFSDKPENERLSVTIWMAAVRALNATTRKAFYRLLDEYVSNATRSA